MISYIEIASRIKDKKHKHDDEDFEYIKCTKFYVPPFTVPVCSTAKGAKSKWITKLSKILTFINEVQDHLEEGRRPSIPISTRYSTNLAIWGNRTSVSDAIKLMIEIGLLALQSADYRFGLADTRFCYTYHYYKDNEEKFVQFCNDNHIKPFVIKQDTKVVKIDATADFDKTKVVFNSDIKLKKLKNYSEKQFKEFLTSCLYENYPQLEYYKNIVNEINEFYDKVNIENIQKLKIKFEPHFEWEINGKVVKSIGIRATCSLNNTSREERPKILKSYCLDKEKDIKSSVPRVTLSLNKGEWFSDDVDLYKKIYDNSEQDEVFPDDEFPDEMREAIKKLFMRAYFDSTEGKMVHHTWREMEQEGVTKQDVYVQMNKLRSAIKKTCCGKIYRAEIFLAESCIYLRVLKRLLESGRIGWLLFDCFYCSGLDGENNEQFSETLDQYIKESFDEYLPFYKKSIALLNQ